MAKKGRHSSSKALLVGENLYKKFSTLLWFLLIVSIFVTFKHCSVRVGDRGALTYV